MSGLIDNNVRRDIASEMFTESERILSGEIVCFIIIVIVIDVVIVIVFVIEEEEMKERFGEKEVERLWSDEREEMNDERQLFVRDVITITIIIIIVRIEMRDGKSEVFDVNRTHV